MSRAAKGSEILPTISPPKPRTSPGVQRPLFKRQKTEAVGNVPSAAITQHNNHLLVSPNTASLNAIAQSTTPETTNVVGYLLSSTCTVWCCDNMVNFLQIRHKAHPIACPLGQAMGCLCEFRLLIIILRQSLHCCMQYRIVLHHIVTAPNCIILQTPTKTFNSGVWEKIMTF